MNQLTRTIQAILFSAPEPVTVDSLIAACDGTKEEIMQSLDELARTLDASGIRLSEHRGTYRLVTAPEAAPSLAKFHDLGIKNELSRAALETLAIIAYQGSTTRHAIEEIRGINSEQMLRNLIQRGLVEEAGKSKEAGRPTLYGVTHLFLETVGITKLSDLPPLPAEEATA
jgi:segregation and condensation protein B